MMLIKAREVDDFTWIFFEATGNRVDRSILGNLSYPEVNGGKGVIFVQGKLPTWSIASANIRYQDECQWLAWYDPNEHGSIVTHSLIPEYYPVGLRIEDPLPCLVCQKDLKRGTTQPYCADHREQSLSRQRYRSKRSKPVLKG